MTGPQPRFSNTLHEYLHSKILTNTWSWGWEEKCFSKGLQPFPSAPGASAYCVVGAQCCHSDVTPQIQYLTAWLLPRWVEHSRDCWAFLASRGFIASATEVMCQLAFICLPTKWLNGWIWNVMTFSGNVDDAPTVRWLNFRDLLVSGGTSTFDHWKIRG